MRNAIPHNIRIGTSNKGNTLIDLIIKLTEKLAGLLKLREERGRRIFEDHVEPIFHDLRTVYEDYKQLLIEAESMFNGNEHTVPDVILFLTKRRSKYEATRKGITQYISILRESERENLIDDFILKALMLLSSEPTFDSRRTIYTKCTSLLSDLRYLVSDEIQHVPKEPIDLVKAYKRDIDGWWEIISESYFELRVSLLK